MSSSLFWALNAIRVSEFRQINDLLCLNHPGDPVNESRQAPVALTFAFGSTYKKPDLSRLFSDASREDVDTGRLSKEIADLLLERYWVNVHPIARTVHRPSLQRIYDGLYGDVSCKEIPSSELALVSAVLFAGLVSMDEQAYDEQISGTKLSKASLEADMQQTTETLLGCCKLLQTTSFRVLQALVVYLVRSFPLQS